MNSTKRKSDDLYVDDNNGDYLSKIATDHEIASRKRITAAMVAMGSPEKGSNSTMNMSSNASLASSPGSQTAGSNRLRKMKRLKHYYEHMYELNTKFSSWCHEELIRTCAKIESGELNKFSRNVPDYNDEALLYIETADMIRKKYLPSTGDVLTFGSGAFGQLGHVYNEDRDNDSMRPRCVMSLRNTGIHSISCGGFHTIALTQNGEVRAWGANEFGASGIVDKETVFVPNKVTGFIPSSIEVANGLEPVNTWKDVEGEDISNPKIPLDPKYEETIVDVATGDVHTLCLSSTGRVYFFGTYKCKDGKSWRDAQPEDDPRFFIKEPETIDPPPSEGEKEEPKPPDVSTEGEKEEPKPPDVPTEGEKEEPKPPDVAPKGYQAYPIHVNKIDGEAIDIDCGFSFSAAIVEKNNTRKCVTWGIGESGELSRPLSSPVQLIRDNGEKYSAVDTIRDEYLVPKPVIWDNPSIKRNVEKIACGGYHLLVVSRNLLDRSCSVHGSGLNNFGQLGLGDIDNRDKLTEIKAFRGKNITQISGGNQHSLALDSNHNLYAFGRGDYGQLGITDSQPKTYYHETVPVSVQLVKGKANPPISQIAAGDNQNIVLTGSGDVYSWGYGDNGCLGHGIIEDENGLSLHSSDECRPRKLDVLKKINDGRIKRGRTIMTADVHYVASGSQHSAIICSLLE